MDSKGLGLYLVRYKIETMGGSTEWKQEKQLRNYVLLIFKNKTLC
jgi:hypothetical protein